MPLPERLFRIKRTDGGYVMPWPAALPYLFPPLGGLSQVHMPTLDKSTEKRPGQQDVQLFRRRQGEDSGGNGLGLGSRGRAGGRTPIWNMLRCRAPG